MAKNSNVVDLKLQPALAALVLDEEAPKPPLNDVCPSLPVIPMLTPPISPRAAPRQFRPFFMPAAIGPPLFSTPGPVSSLCVRPIRPSAPVGIATRIHPVRARYYSVLPRSADRVPRGVRDVDCTMDEYNRDVQLGAYTPRELTKRWRRKSPGRRFYDWLKACRSETLNKYQADWGSQPSRCNAERSVVPASPDIGSRLSDSRASSWFVPSDVVAASIAGAMGTSTGGTGYIPLSNASVEAPQGGSGRSGWDITGGTTKGSGYISLSGMSTEVPQGGFSSAGWDFTGRAMSAYEASVNMFVTAAYEASVESLTEEMEEMSTAESPAAATGTRLDFGNAALGGHQQPTGHSD